MATQLKDENEIKIFILYLLDKIGYPLDYPSIGSIMMQDGIVNFFDFAQCFFDQKASITNLAVYHYPGIVDVVIRARDAEADAMKQVLTTRGFNVVSVIENK